jgi:hypothetical protein
MAKIQQRKENISVIGAGFSCSPTPDVLITSASLATPLNSPSLSFLLRKRGLK